MVFAAIDWSGARAGGGARDIALAEAADATMPVTSNGSAARPEWGVGGYRTKMVRMIFWLRQPARPVKLTATVQRPRPDAVNV